MDWKPDDELLTRYVAGEASTEERAQVDTWLAADPTRRERVDRLRRLWQSAHEAGDRPDACWEAEREWKRLARRIGLPEERGGTDESKPHPERRPVRRDRRQRRRAASPHVQQGSWRRVAARVVAGVLVVAAAAFLMSRAGGLPWTDADVPAGAVYTTATGERAEVRLADGTAVQLAPESRLTVAFDAGTGQRRVRLDGQGFFEVARDTTRPFVVRTENASTRVLGTAFNVRAYKGAGALQVVVAEGRVAVRPSDGRGRLDNRVVLTAKQYARLSTEGSLEVSAVRSLNAHLAWREGQLNFQNTSLQDVLRRLEHWYDFEGEIADSSLAQRPLTAAFTGKAPLEETLNALALAIKARYEHTGPNSYTFYRNSRLD